MAPAIVNAILGRASESAPLGPIEVASVLLARDELPSVVNDPESGIIHPQDINNNAVFAMFGLLGAAFVVVGIWFFFWAKNGGFYFKKTDWDDYTSTVLRRKVGPNGTIYSDATPSTILGGGSIYKDIDDRTTTVGDDNTTVVSGTTGITGITGGVSDISGRERRRKRREQKEREKERRREEKMREKEEKRSRKSRRKIGEDGMVIDEEAAAEAEEQLRSYRHEKPARVGGLNREADGSEWDGSTNPTWSTVSPSSRAAPSEITTTTEGTGSTVTDDLLGNRQRTPTNSPTKSKDAARIRKVYSTAEKTARREDERLRAEARRLQEKGRAAVAASSRGTAASASASADANAKAVAIRRDFSFVRGAEERVALRRIEELPAPAESVVSDSTALSAATASTADNDRNREREARRQHARSRSRHERSSRVVESEVGGTSVVSGSSADDDEVGTKVYTHSHHIPTGAESSIAPESSISNYADERRRKRRSQRASRG
ncbi:hypothetical protein VTJ83DRAFT_3361 [Remersonia thermophila]|uniref:Endosomal spry domain-containing protein n=1 Tax=Remersonia thermophila TaxID=72144 RepID=A0ABR4DEF9_9PEZI